MKVKTEKYIAQSIPCKIFFGLDYFSKYGVYSSASPWCNISDSQGHIYVNNWFGSLQSEYKVNGSRLNETIKNYAIHAYKNSSKTNTTENTGNFSSLEFF